MAAFAVFSQDTHHGTTLLSIQPAGLGLWSGLKPRQLIPYPEVR